MKNTDRPLDWGNIAFLTLSPIAAIVGGIYYTHHYGVEWYEMALFVAMFFATGLSITGGYHRHFAHAAYQAHPLIRIFYLVFGACAMQNSALHWAADHRLHHRFTDTENDPYNAGQGFWYSHIGWIFHVSPKDRDFSIVADLLKDRWVRFQHEHNVSIGLIVGFGIPLLFGLATGRIMGALLWGGLIRVVFVHHATFFINSLAHMWGRQPYSRSDSSRDSWWLAFLTNGEGYHNFHHRFPSDYRNGVHWYQWDPTKWLIAGMNYIGLTDRLHRIPAHLILKARMEVEALDAEKRLQQAPHELGAALRVKLSIARERMEHALAQWAETKARYREAAVMESRAVRLHWKQKVKEYEARLAEAKQNWRAQLQVLQRMPAADI